MSKGDLEKSLKTARGLDEGGQGFDPRVRTSVHQVLV